MKPAKLLFVVVALLASSAWAQTLPKDSEIKVRTDTAIPAKPVANAKYVAMVSNDVTDSSGTTSMVKTSASSRVTKTVASSVKSIAPGSVVAVVGPQAQDGSYTATSISVANGANGG